MQEPTQIQSQNHWSSSGVSPVCRARTQGLNTTTHGHNTKTNQANEKNSKQTGNKWATDLKLTGFDELKSKSKGENNTCAFLLQALTVPWLSHEQMNTDHGVLTRKPHCNTVAFFSSQSFIPPSLSQIISTSLDLTFSSHWDYKLFRSMKATVPLQWPSTSHCPQVGSIPKWQVLARLWQHWHYKHSNPIYQTRGSRRRIWESVL